MVQSGGMTAFEGNRIVWYADSSSGHEKEDVDELT